VNCFQKFVSLTSKTTFGLAWWYERSCELLSKICIFDIENNAIMPRSATGWLWIAFKNLYLWHRKQLVLKCQNVDCSCELLSKICIFDIENNKIIVKPLYVMLWIAFKNLYLWHRKQLQRDGYIDNVCCELLSKICIFDIENNYKHYL